MPQDIVIDIQPLYGATAKLAQLDAYVAEAKSRAGGGNDVVLTAQGRFGCI
jgi:hypothetical protein